MLCHLVLVNVNETVQNSFYCFITRLPIHTIVKNQGNNLACFTVLKLKILHVILHYSIKMIESVDVVTLTVYCNSYSLVNMTWATVLHMSSSNSDQLFKQLIYFSNLKKTDQFGPKLPLLEEVFQFGQTPICIQLYKTVKSTFLQTGPALTSSQLHWKCLLLAALLIRSSN